MIRLKPQLVADWPKLAWVARLPSGADELEVLHGPMVEVADDWIAEAVWAGDFAKGAFDQTDLVFGSGLRIRADRATFVSAGTAMDRLWHCTRTGRHFVSNSLPALLAVAQLCLRDDYPSYREDIETVEYSGIRSCVKAIPTTTVDVNVLYFSDLVYDGHELKEVDKPGISRTFRTFSDYFDFLTSTARQLSHNMRFGARANEVRPLVGISSGYDSCATAVVAKYAGCTEAVSIANSTSLWRGCDSGEAIADLLGMSCRVYRHRRENYRLEESIWAAAGRAGGLNFTLFDYPEPLCAFFCGSYGDTVWDRTPHDLSEPAGNFDCLLGEFRVLQGIFNCVVPWWGVRQAQQIHAINSLEEMDPWTLHSDYDRPIARRIVEEAGVPRGTFATIKRNTSANDALLWPFTRRAQDSFASYLRRRGVYAPPRWAIGPLRAFSRAGNLLYQNAVRPLGWRKWWRPWLTSRSRELLFQWANHELKKRYREGLAGANLRSAAHREAVQA